MVTKKRKKSTVTDVLSHKLIPEMKVLSDAEKAKMLKKYGIEERQLTGAEKEQEERNECQQELDVDDSASVPDENLFRRSSSARSFRYPSHGSTR